MLTLPTPALPLTPLVSLRPLPPPCQPSTSPSAPHHPQSPDSYPYIQHHLSLVKPPVLDVSYEYMRTNRGKGRGDSSRKRIVIESRWGRMYFYRNQRGPFLILPHLGETHTPSPPTHHPQNSTTTSSSATSRSPTPTSQSQHTSSLPQTITSHSPPPPTQRSQALQQPAPPPPPPPFYVGGTVIEPTRREKHRGRGPGSRGLFRAMRQGPNRKAFSKALTPRYLVVPTTSRNAPAELDLPMLFIKAQQLERALKKEREERQAAVKAAMEEREGQKGAASKHT
ncbi:hypothetical protein B0H34DRAFT_794329 [Crassisporium funariophilum]|nr:hypothetical protein B0H34DRAFT_794329 [Crassisporium funariophilum]